MDLILSYILSFLFSSFHPHQLKYVCRHHASSWKVSRVGMMISHLFIYISELSKYYATLFDMSLEAIDSLP